MILAIGNRTTINVRDFQHASEEYGREREASGEGGSTFPEGRVMKGGHKIARVSYNGRVWPWPDDPKAKPLYDNRWSNHADLYPAQSYVETDRTRFEEAERILKAHGGRSETLVDPLPIADRLRSCPAIPSVCDYVIISQTMRLDGFTAQGRYFILAES